MYFRRIWLCCLLIPSQVLALSTDRQQPLKIEADQAHFDNQQGLAVYDGNVVVIQGSIRLTADKVTIYLSQVQQDVSKVVATGKPAYFQQRLDQGDDVKAKAEEMEYNAVENRLYLRLEAELRKEKAGEDTYVSNAPCISYDTQGGIIQADKCNHKKDRVITIVIPQNKPVVDNPKPPVTNVSSPNPKSKNKK
jgi:lipopolysaccharide export system protein LptA